ncbi:nitroreductase [Phytohabitans houttuyneae]|nr:nitroreductase [Phytohabitans houttuyneae]
MTGDGLDLHLDSSRPVDVTDPDARLATLSCGAALHHARVSLGAQGWRATVTRMPDVARPEHLARVQADDPAPKPIEPLMVRREQTIGLRHTDRRELSGRRVGADALAAIITAVHAQGSLLHVLYPNQVLDLAAAADLAQGQTDETGWLAELASWNAGPSPTGPHDRPALFAILYGRGDQPINWLRAGEALSAAWLTATEIGVSLLPLSATIEMTHTREAIRVLLTSVGYPYLVLRLRTTDQDDAGQARQPQLPIDQIPSPSRSA